MPLGRARRLGLLALLYIAQGLPFGFQANALPQFLRVAGMSLEHIGLAGALAAPWMFKALWAPFVDRHFSARFGRRKSWIVPAQLCLMLTCIAASFTPVTTHLQPLLLLLFLSNLFAATQDIAVDGFAVDVLKREELGLGNAVQVVGYRIGMVLGGGALVYASAWVGWSGLFLGMALMMAVPLVSMLRTREVPATVDQHHQRLSEVLSLLWRAFRTPGAAWLLLFVATYKTGEAMAERMFGPMLVDRGFKPEETGLWLGVYGVGAAIVGSLAGGYFSSRLGAFRAVVFTAGLRVVGLAAQWLIAANLVATTPGTIIAATCVEHLLAGSLTTAMFAFMMSRVDRRIGATHYTLLASVEVLGKSPLSLASGYVASSVGYGGVFAIAMVWSLAFLAFALAARRSLGQELVHAEVLSS